MPKLLLCGWEAIDKSPDMCHLQRQRSVQQADELSKYGTSSTRHVLHVRKGTGRNAEYFNGRNEKDVACFSKKKKIRGATDNVLRASAAEFKLSWPSPLSFHYTTIDNVEEVVTAGTINNLSR